MEYLYPPLVDITNTPKEEVIKIVRVNTIEKRHKNKEMTKEVYEAKLDRAKKGIKEPEEPKPESQEEPIEPEKEKDKELKDK